MDKTKLLFICLGNICRSPAAHAVMQKYVEDAGVENRFEIDSAGIGPWHVGELPDKRMRKHGAMRGYDISHIARQFFERPYMDWPSLGGNNLLQYPQHFFYFSFRYQKFSFFKILT